VVVVVQARMGSSRLPAKVLLDLGGEIALHRTLSRAARIPGVHQVVVATSTEPADEVIAWAAEARGFSVTRGSEKDVLSRFLLAAQIHQADVIMRVTSDCPLLDPAVSGLVLDGFLRSGTLGYASNVVTRALPRGLDTEVFSRAALERAADSTDARAREHVTWGMYSHPDKFRCGEFLPAWVVPGLAAHRWTLDTLADYHFLASIYHRLGPTAGAASAQEVLDLLRREPALQAINADISQVAV
jgi:spore coat polysaccharide biosynthesis protein SpsF (cytidylyltransferase family)